MSVYLRKGVRVSSGVWLKTSSKISSDNINPHGVSYWYIQQAYMREIFTCMLAAHIIMYSLLSRSQFRNQDTSFFFYLPRSLQCRRNLDFTLLIVSIASSTLFQMSCSSASCTGDVVDFVFMIELAHPYNLVWILPTSTVISIFV